MTAISFFLGYFSVEIAAVNALSRNDPEPIGAAASLALFAFFGAVVSLVSFLERAYALNTFPGKYSSAIGGILSSAVFFLAVSAVHLGTNLLLCVCIALVLSPVAAAAWPYVNRSMKKGRRSQNARFRRHRMSP
jgi:hypothetical protein